MSIWRLANLTAYLLQCTEKKLAKKKENEARLALKAAKAAKAAATAPAGDKKAKKEKEKDKEDEAPFVNTTPKGDKKGAQPPAITYHPASHHAHKTSRSRWPAATTQLLSKLPGTTGGTLRATSLLS